MDGLLAVDVGLHTGLARFDRDGRLTWYRSTNFGGRARLKAGVHSLLTPEPRPEVLIIEGGGELAKVWEREAARRGIGLERVSAETWRERLLLPRQRVSGAKAKQQADALARRVIEWSGAKRPTSLTHDAAEAVLIGLYGVLRLGWLQGLPEEIKDQRKAGS